MRWETIASEDILDLFPGPMADESLLFHEESSVETTVTYTLEREGRLIVVENVPARVDTETGEQFFSPQTEERLQEIARDGKPARVIEARVFDFAQSTSKTTAGASGGCSAASPPGARRLGVLPFPRGLTPRLRS